MKNLMLSFSVALGAAFALDAEPVFTNRGIINGLATFSVDNLGDASIEVERWDVASGAFVAQGVYRTATSGTESYYIFGNDSNGERHFGEFDCRMRVAGSETWTEITYSTAYDLSGTPIWGTTKFSTAGEYAFDGNPNTYVEPNYLPSWDPASWIGLDLGKPQMISGCLVYPRPIWANRLSGRVIEVSDVPDFAVKTVAGTIPSASNGRVTKCVFDSPVRGRYVRFASGSVSEIWNISELCFITPEHTTTLDIEVEPADSGDGDFRAKLSWDSAKVLFSKLQIYSAPASGGPWTRLAEIDDAFTQNSWTNDVLSAEGEKIYYAVADVSSSGIVSALGSPKLFVRPGRIDVRDENGLLMPGFTPFGMRDVTWKPGRSVSLVFDGKVNEYCEGLASGSGAIALGLDMGADYVVCGLRYYPRGGWAVRLGGLSVYGTADGQDPLCASAKINGVAISQPPDAKFTDKFVGYCEVPTRYCYLYEPPNENTLHEFHGNINELQIYGYPASALTNRLSVCETPTVLQRKNGLLAMWEPCQVATSYELERRAEGTEWATVYSGLGVSYLDTSVVQGVEYQYRVKVAKDALYGYSNVTFVKFAGAVTPVSSQWDEAYTLGSGVSGTAIVSPDGTVSISALGGEIDRYGEKGVWLRREVKTDFVSTCSVSNDTALVANGETVYLTVRATETEGAPFVVVGFKSMSSFDGRHFCSFSVRTRRVVNGPVEETVAWTAPVEGLSAAQLRLRQTAGKVRCFVRQESDDDWTDLAVVRFAPGTFGPKVQTGIMASTTLDASMYSGSPWIVTDYTCDPITQGIKVIFR